MIYANNTTKTQIITKNIKISAQNITHSRPIEVNGKLQKIMRFCTLTFHLHTSHELTTLKNTDFRP